MSWTVGCSPAADPGGLAAWRAGGRAMLAAERGPWEQVGAVEERRVWSGLR